MKNPINGRAAKPLSSFAYLGVLPFLLFALAFMLLPSGALLFGAFQDAHGRLTFANIAALFDPSILNSYAISIQVSAATSVGGVVAGFLLAHAITMGRLPKAVRSFVVTFSGVASNFAGVPLAFAFISTFGRVGMVTFILKQLFGISLYDGGFNLYSFWGLTITYIYFQIPLMVLIISPTLDGMRREWREAAENLGAGAFTYWLRVGFPILLPSLLSSLVLLFGNAFGAYATAYALTGGLINLVPILIGAQIRGNVLYNPNLGYALALGMVVVMAVALAAYVAMQRLTARWLK
ncbi:MAG TPA: ABC transporter permease subunit [Spirochaetia bacterium]|nr:ABC transporter permease subunit [Spirochaetia bacterium]